ncbi:MAG: toll/interleukin-1 receptor domain-containing protein [Nitrospinales bacterium]|jgi:hypothetical protein
MNEMQDVFISHAHKDVEKYITPLVNAFKPKGRNIKFWRDAGEIGGIDSVAKKINEGLRSCRIFLPCLSQNYMESEWCQKEMWSALSQHIDSGKKSIFLLILNSKKEVFEKYPLLGDLKYRLFEQGVESIADELATLCAAQSSKKNGLSIRVESAHSGVLCDIIESPDVSVEWLASKATAALGGKDRADVGALERFMVRWILVDVRAEDYYRSLTNLQRQEIWAVVKVEDELRKATEGTTSLRKLGVEDGTVFHLWGIVPGTIVLKKESPPRDPLGGGGRAIMS